HLRSVDDAARLTRPGLAVKITSAEGQAHRNFSNSSGVNGRGPTTDISPSRTLRIDGRRSSPVRCRNTSKRELPNRYRLNVRAFNPIVSLLLIVGAPADPTIFTR